MSKARAPDFPEGVAVVFGGSGGVGREIALLLAEHGANVALTYRQNAVPAGETVERIKQMGRTAQAYAVDICDADRVQQVFASAESEFGRVHTLIVACGPNIRLAYVSNVTRDEFESAIKNDLVGTFNIISSALPLLRKEGGAIVALSTAALAHYSPMDLLSVAPKGGVEAIMRAVAREEGRHSIRANMLALGVIDGGIMDRLWDGLSPDFAARMKSGNALRRMGTPEEAAEAAVFLASRRSSYITGQRLVLDGGYAI